MEVDFDFNKYQRMYASGVSEATIRKRMEKEGFDPDVYLEIVKRGSTQSSRDSHARSPPPRPPRRTYNSPQLTDPRKRLNFDMELEDGYYTSGSESESLAETMMPVRRSMARISAGAQKLKPKFLARKITSGYYYVRSMFVKNRVPQSPIPPPRPVYMYSDDYGERSGKKGRGNGRESRRSSPWSSSQSSRYSSHYSSRKSSVISKKSGRKSSQLSRKSTPPSTTKEEKTRKTKEERRPDPQPNRRKTSVFAGLQRFARRKSSVGPGINASHLTPRIPIRGVVKRRTGMQNSPSLRQRMQIYKAKVSSDQTVNNHVPQKKPRKWKPPVVEAYKPQQTAKERAPAKSGQVKAKTALFEDKAMKKLREENRVLKAELKTKSWAQKQKAAGKLSPGNKTTFGSPGTQKSSWSPSSQNTNGSPSIRNFGKQTPRSTGKRNTTRRKSRSRRRSYGERSAKSDATDDHIAYDDDEDGESFYYDEEEEELPEGWIKVYSEEWDEFFYVDTRTEESTWERPI